MKPYSCLFFLFLGFSLMGQNYQVKSDFWGNVRFGGGIGLGFTNGGFNAAISPSAIYQVNDQLATGVSLNFNYAKYNEDKLYAYGGSILTLFNPIPYLQLSGELEQLRINRTYGFIDGNVEDNYWSPALFLGIGYSNRNVTVGIRYDVLYDENKSIYANDWMPFVRVYF
ncbi:MAG: alpha-ketoglutarate decarboxylase [Maribacter sp.]|nr:alpha-ketoglutarate decarboxylase [Maribacter sp.]MBT8314377.1 alpha-ketoglutarate decarboxylase [Maribacter sp.]